jgi:transposase
MDAAALQQENTTLKDQVISLQREITLLRQKLDALARRFFGKKSEQLDAAQLELLLQGLSTGALELTEEEATPARSVPRQAATTSQRLRTPENLEVVSEVIEPELVRAEPQHYQRIGEEKSRLLDYQPGKFFWREIVRPKYVRLTRRELPPVIAPAAARVAEHMLAAPGLLAQLLVGKYCDHLPFYREEQIFLQRHGVFIARQQMVQWTEQSVRLLSGITRAIKEQLRQSPYAQVDETPVQYLEPGHGQTKQGYLWTALVPGRCVLYQWHASRAAECLHALLGRDFKGKLQCDGYSAYPAFAQDKIKLFGCWAHYPD